MPIPFVADMHCHPQSRAFNYFRNNPEKISNVCNDFPKEWSPWVLPPGDTKDKTWQKQLAGKRPGCFAQADFNRMAVGRVRLVFASLYPLEGGFVRGKQSKSFWSMIHALLKPISLIAENNGVRAIAQCLQMKYPLHRIQFFQRKRKEEGSYMDYWNEMQLEYYFLAARDRVWQSHVFHYAENESTCAHSTDVYTQKSIRLQHRYCIAQSKKQLNDMLDPNALKNSIAVVLTIEGGHILSMDGSNKPLPWNVIQQRLLALKHWGIFSNQEALTNDLKDAASLRRWAEKREGSRITHPIFMLNLSHHFNNYLAAHARSLPDKLRLIMDQSDGMDIKNPVSDMGRRVIEMCLNIKRIETNGFFIVEDNLQGNRILIDVKHMSPASRKIFYEDYILPYNARHPLNPIPVVATHVGVVGDAYRSLEALHQQELRCLIKDLKDADVCAEGFLQWGINICEEDIAVICASKGIIALSMDQRILGNAHGASGAADLIRNLKYVISVAKKHEYKRETSGDSVWNFVALGSDFDGFIDPLNTCPSVMHYEHLYAEMESLLEEESDTLFEPYGRKKCLEHLFWQNATDFTQKHFPEPIMVQESMQEMV